MHTSLHRHTATHSPAGECGVCSQTLSAFKEIFDKTTVCRIWVNGIESFIFKMYLAFIFKRILHTFASACIHTLWKMICFSLT